MKTHYHLVDSNKTKSWLIITGFIAFISLVTYVMVYALGGDMSAVLFAVIVSTFMSIGSYYFSDQIILSISSAVPANKREHFDFYTVTENLSRAAGVPMPKLYVIEDTAMNAFATGRDPKHAVICATTGLLARLDRTEIEAVVAHELAHVKNYDIRLMSIVTILVGMITLLADWLLRFGLSNRKNEERDSNLGTIMFIAGLILALLSPLVAQIIQLAISRRREFLADATGVSFTRYPEGLARALEKISQDTEPLEAANKATAHLYISNPLKNHHDSIGWFANLFSTHPPVKERLSALRSRE